MATDAAFAAFVMDQLSGVGQVSQRKMFGEYAVYVGTKVVALLCDNALFVKPTQAGRQYIGAPLEAVPYPKGKPWFLIQDEIEDRQWLQRLVTLTESELPLPKPKAAPKPKVAAKVKAAAKTKRVAPQ